MGDEVGLSAAAFRAKVERGEVWQEQEKRLFKHRAQEIVSSLQMRELNETIKTLGELLSNHKSRYYILIDDLDLEWAGNQQTQYALLRALIECIKAFRRIANLKIIVAMREDLYEAMLRQTTDKHFQSEKHEGIIKRLRWSKDFLLRVIDKRINQLHEFQYTKQSVRLADVLPDTILQVPTRVFLTRHTLQRPRDVIALVNKVLAINEGATLPLSARAVTKAEPDFSRDRLRALEEEWRSCHPLIRRYLECLRGLNEPEPVGILDEDRLIELIFEVADLQRAPFDEVERVAKTIYERDKESRVRKLALALVCCLFKVGAVGVRVHHDQGYTFCYDQHSTIQESEISISTKFVVHPMLQSALGSYSDHSEAA